jgi:single-strand DNA-binding protein
MAGVNKAILVGNLGRDPEVKTLEGGAKVATFSLATTETYRNKDGERTEQTEWHNLVLWRGLADIAEKYLHKGSSIYVEGRIRTRSWEDQNGQKRYTTEVEVQNLVMLGGRRDDQTPPPPPPPQAGSPSRPPAGNAEPDSAGDDDLPF